jgi:hypothetical protein
MGKKAKEHRAKVAKRNRRIEQEKYAAQKAFQKMIESVRESQEAKTEESYDENKPFDVVTEPPKTGIKGFEFEGNVSFKEENPEILTINQNEPEFDSAGFLIEDREEQKQ